MEAIKRALFPPILKTVKSLRVVFPAACGEFVIPVPIFIGINSSRNPEDRTGFRIKCGMTE
jgi:Na+/H+ antiporter NhaA